MVSELLLDLLFRSDRVLVKKTSLFSFSRFNATITCLRTRRFCVMHKKATRCLFFRTYKY